MTGVGRKVLKGWGSGRHTPSSGVMGIKIQGAPREGREGSAKGAKGREDGGREGSVRCGVAKYSAALA